MNKLILIRYHETNSKYKKLRKRLDKKIQNRSFYKLTKIKQRDLVYRLRRLYEKLLNLKRLLKLAAAGTTFAVALNVGQLEAQNFNKKTPFKKQNKNNIVLKKDFKPGLFVQERGTNNPFGGENPFDGLWFDSDYINLVDIDNDGDLDVFSISNPYGGGIIKYYKNEGDNFFAEITEQTGANNPFNGFDFENRPYLSFVDIDGDDDYDAVINDQAVASVRYFKNTGDNTNPIFLEQTNSDNPFAGIDPQSMDRLNFADIDNDGDLDVFIGIYNNYPQLFRNTGSVDEPIFEAQTDVFFNNIPYFLESLVLSDIDNDGDFDAITNGGEFWENQGDINTPFFIQITGEDNPFDETNSWGDLILLTDIDDDGDHDLLFGSYNFISYYENTGSASNAVFENKNGRIKDSFVIFHDFADIDYDGDKDMIFGYYDEIDDAGKIGFYKNTGTTTNPNFEEQTGTNNPFNNINFPEEYIQHPDFVDIDSDGDYDVFIGSSYYTEPVIMYFENTGTVFNPVFEEQTGADNPLNGVTDIYYAFLDFVRIDNDGDYDCFFGEYYSDFHFMRNTGTPLNPVFEEEASPVTTNSYINIPEFTDIDKDGDFDLFLGCRDYDNGWEVKYFENTGDNTSPVFTEQTGDDNPLNLNSLLPVLSFVDIDSDGDEDCFIGTYGGILLYFRNRTGEIGLENTAENNELIVYPNPSKGIVNLKAFNGPLSVEITDISGKQIINMQVSDSKIDVSSLAAGIYILKARTDKITETVKIIIQK